MPGQSSRSVGLLLVAAVVLALGHAMSIPGSLSIDEVTYSLSARSLALGHGIEVWNGYEETPSAALAPAWLKPIGGRLVSQYPDFFLFLALPAYRVLGFRGLFMVNVTAFVVVCALIWSLAARRFGARVAATSVALFAGASFAWEYAVAAWPHMVATLFVVTPLVLVDRLVELPSARRRIALAVAAGLVAGFGVGVRLDVAFALAALFAALLLQRPARWLEGLALVAGSLPPLTGLALLNRAKFGLTTPFTYGPSYGIAVGIGPYVPLLAAGGVLGALIWLATRPAISRHLRPHRLGAVAAVALVAALALPSARAAIVAAARGFGELLLDLRLREIERVDPASSRGPDGSVLYFASLKKALLQSCPWLLLTIPPLIAARRERGTIDRFVLWLAVPVAFVVPYGVFSWDGGLCLNQRYFLPALPVLVILGALGLEQLVARASLKSYGVWLAAATGLAAMVGVAAAVPFDTGDQALLLLTFPLAVAAALGAALVAPVLRPRLPPIATARVAVAIAGVAIGVATYSCLLYDLPRTLGLRGAYAANGDVVRAAVGNDALLMSEPVELLAAAITPESRHRLANPGRDGYRTFLPLVRHSLGDGRPVLFSARPATVERLMEAGLLDEFVLSRVPAAAGLLLRLEYRGAATGESKPVRPE
jgi:hypothetical protein